MEVFMSLKLKARLLVPAIAAIAVVGAVAGLAAIASADVNVSSQVNSSSDDAYHGADFFPGYSSTDILVYSGWPNAGGNRSSTGGWRFTSLNLPACAIITGAYAEIAAAYHGYETTTTLSLEDAANPPTFTPDNTPLHRWANHTSFTAMWTTGVAPQVVWHQTPSLIAGVQELIDSFGAIDTIVLLENGDATAPGYYHGWLSYDKGAEYAAKLFITYYCDEPDPTPTPTPTNTPTPTPTNTPTPPAGGEGCTPGYWKQEHHFGSWVGYAPSDSFDTVFGVDSSFVTLLDAVGANGGGENALGRHAVAALLNAASADVDSSFTTAGVIQMVQDAYESGDFETTKNKFAADNESGCPLGRDEGEEEIAQSTSKVKGKKK
jgi:hypothetical protein